MAIQDRLSDSTAYNWTAWLYKACGIRSSKKTYAGRVSGARVAEENGVSEDQVYNFLFSSPHLFFLSLTTNIIDSPRRPLECRSNDRLLFNNPTTGIYEGDSGL